MSAEYRFTDYEYQAKKLTGQITAINYHRGLNNQPKIDLDTALLALKKRIYRHFGLDNKYDGSGRRR